MTALRKSSQSVAQNGNVAKADSYREAWTRINKSIDAGFYLEAVTIVESIISDRLLSYAWSECPNAEGFNGERTHFYNLINALPDESLKVKLHAWREQRNRVVHAAAKSFPGTPTEDVDEFLGRAKSTADEGRQLAREVSNWHKKELRKNAGRS